MSIAWQKITRISDDEQLREWIPQIIAIILLCIIGVSCVHCQAVDIYPTRADQTFIVLGRNLQYNVTGGGAGDCSISQCGFNNNFIFPSLYTQESLCITVFNGNSSNVTFRIKIAATNDPSVTQFQNNQSRWSTPTPVSGVTNIASGAVTVNAGAFGNFYAQISGASRVAIIISNSTALAGTGADVIVSQQPTNTSAYQTGSITTPPNQATNANLISFGNGAGGTVNSYNVASPGGNAQQGPTGVLDYVSDNGGGNVGPIGSVWSFADGNNSFSSFMIPAHGEFLFNGTGWDRARSGTSTGSVLINGDKTNNAAAPGANNVGVLPAIANAAAPTNTEGNQVLNSATLRGEQRVVISQNGTPVIVGNNNNSQIGAGQISLFVDAFSYQNNAVGNWIPSGKDPCQNSALAKTSIFKDITTATTTAVVASSGSTVVYVCGYSINMTGTVAADTLLLEDGTGAACATTQVQKTPNYSSGVLTAGATTITVGFAGQTVFSTATSGEICAVSTVGTGPTISLMVTYVQQ